MNVTYACPSCGGLAACDRLESRASLECPSCGGVVVVPEGAVRDGHVERCVVCPSRELFVRKDFPQRLGVGIVVVGFAASCVAWGMRELFWTFGILFATAAIDVVLYLVMPECLTCYRCGARYRGPGATRRHGRFDLETHERHRQALARVREHAAADRAP